MQISVQDHPVSYEVHGHGQPIVFLPGWTQSAHTLANMTEPSIGHRQGWQRIYIDPPGHGATPGANWISNLDDMVSI